MEKNTKSESEPVTKILSIALSGGTPEFPRYRIHDQYMQYWTGSDWSSDESKGELFAVSNDACVQVQKLLMLDYMDKKVTSYQAPVKLELFSDKEIPLIEIKRWLHRVAKLLVDSPEFGNGPVQGSLGLLTIEWGELEKVKE